MLVLKRKEGQWVEIIHHSGDVIRLRVYDIQSTPGTPSRANLAFDDAARNFEIRRPDRRVAAPKPAAVADVETVADRVDVAIEVALPVAEAVIAIEPEAEFGLKVEGGAATGSIVAAGA